MNKEGQWKIMIYEELRTRVPHLSDIKTQCTPRKLMFISCEKIKCSFESIKVYIHLKNIIFNFQAFLLLTSFKSLTE
jgi:hypothetical protein